MAGLFQSISSKKRIFHLTFILIFSSTWPTEVSGKVLIESSNHLFFGLLFDINTIDENDYPELIDLDGDSDMDFIYGNEMGEIYKQENIGT